MTALTESELAGYVGLVSDELTEPEHWAGVIEHIEGSSQLYAQLVDALRVAARGDAGASDAVEAALTDGRDSLATIYVERYLAAYPHAPFPSARLIAKYCGRLVPQAELLAEQQVAA